MCLSLLRNKFFLIGLLIYIIPALSFWAYIFAFTPTHGFFPMDISFVVFLIAFIVSLVAYPLFLLYFQVWTWFSWLALYYIIAYGILYLYWKRSKKKKNED
jgi:Ca2+/Na+ antiporter